MSRDLYPAVVCDINRKHSGYRTVDKRKWYYRLCKGPDALLNQTKYRSHTDGLIVCWSQEHRMYSYFKSVVEFTTHQHMVSPDKRTFHEIILSTQLQKPHFDVDFPQPVAPGVIPDDVVSSLTTAVISELARLDLHIIPEQHILTYTSHRPDKYSYHIIIDGFYHRNNVEARAFRDRVVAHLPLHVQSKIDPAVYSSKQQFRIIGNCKYGTLATKTLLNPWVLAGDNGPIYITHQTVEPAINVQHAALMEMFESLVTHSQRKFVVIPELVIAKPPLPLQSVELSTTLIDRALKLLPDLDAYELTEVKNQLVILKRVKASYCKLCDVEHEHENPYLHIKYLPNRRQVNVYFNCRRHTLREDQYFGTLDVVSGDIVVMDTSTPPPEEMVEPIPLPKNIIFRGSLECDALYMKEHRATRRARLRPKVNTGA